MPGGEHPLFFSLSFCLASSLSLGVFFLVLKAQLFNLGLSLSCRSLLFFEELGLLSSESLGSNPLCFQPGSLSCFGKYVGPDVLGLVLGFSLGSGNDLGTLLLSLLFRSYSLGFHFLGKFLPHGFLFLSPFQCRQSGFLFSLGLSLGIKPSVLGFGA